MGLKAVCSAQSGGETRTQFRVDGMINHRPRPTKFVADAMLGSLARKMRALGFGTLYYSEGDDNEIIRKARSGGRVILTSDRSLSNRQLFGKVHVLFLSGKTDDRRLASLLAAAKLSGISLVRGRPHCSLCNGDLRKVKRVDVAGRVPPQVENRHRLFLKCLVCGHFYWRGSHWKKLRRFERILAGIPIVDVS